MEVNGTDVRSKRGIEDEVEWIGRRRNRTYEEDGGKGRWRME